MVYPQQAYERIFENATFTFFGAFSTIEDFVMKQEIELLHTICETEGFEWFKTAIRMSKPRVRVLSLIKLGQKGRRTYKTRKRRRICKRTT